MERWSEQIEAARARGDVERLRALARDVGESAADYALDAAQESRRGGDPEMREIAADFFKIRQRAYRLAARARAEQR